jgi:hypothetical protein
MMQTAISPEDASALAENGFGADRGQLAAAVRFVECSVIDLRSSQVVDARMELTLIANAADHQMRMR